MNRRIVLAALALFLVAVAGWYFGSPRWTLYQMKAAAEAGDVDKLAGFIDFPKLRVSLKEEVKAKAAAQLKTAQGIEALGAIFAINMVDGLIDAMITPSVLREVFVRDKESGREGMKTVDATGDDLLIDQSGFDRFVLRSPKAGAGALIFERFGLGWKLTGMRLPSENTASAPASERSTVGTAPASASENAPAQPAEQSWAGDMADAVDEPVAERPKVRTSPADRPSARVSPGLDPDEVAADAVTDAVNERRARDEPQQ